MEVNEAVQVKKENGFTVATKNPEEGKGAMSQDFTENKDGSLTPQAAQNISSEEFDKLKEKGTNTKVKDNS